MAAKVRINFVISKNIRTFVLNMAKDKIMYVCSNCGQEAQKWVGKCPNCGQWNTFKEIRVAGDTASTKARNAASASTRAGEIGRGMRNASRPMLLR